MKYNWLFVILICVILTTTGCERIPLLNEILSSLPKPTADIQNAQVVDLDAESLTLNFDVEITNPYQVPLPMTALRYDIAAGSTAASPFLSGEAPAQGAVPAKGSRVYEIPVRVGFSELLDTARSIRPGMAVPYRANLDVQVEPPGTTEPLALPIGHSGQIPVPLPPEIEVKGIEWESLSLANAKGVMRMNIRNANEFAAQLGGMKYSLNLSGVDVVDGAIDETLKFGANDSTEIEIPIAIKPLSLGTAIYNALKSGETEYSMNGLFDVETEFGSWDEEFTRSGIMQMRN